MTEHHTEVFEDGTRVCKHCGRMLRRNAGISNWIHVGGQECQVTTN